jgi:hypothetical protein
MHFISRIQGMKLMVWGVLDNLMSEMKLVTLNGCPLTLNLVTWVKIFKELLALQVRSCTQK